MSQLQKLVGLSLLLCLSSGLLQGNSIIQPATLTAARKEIKTALLSGEAFVVVVANEQTASAEEETYGDWADNLNRFAASKPGGLKIIRLTRISLGRLVVEPKIAKHYATVFVRDAKHALVYDGPIVEQNVYQLGMKFINGNSSKNELTDNGLSETRIQLVAQPK